MPYKVLEHTADLAFEVTAPTLSELFEECAWALFSEILEDINKVEPRKWYDIQLRAESLEDLLVSWLNELLFRFDATGEVFSEFDVEVEGNSLWARIGGEKIDLRRHKARLGAKSVTYHMLKVRKIDSEYMATFLVDI